MKCIEKEMCVQKEMLEKNLGNVGEKIIVRVFVILNKFTRSYICWEWQTYDDRKFIVNL